MIEITDRENGNHVIFNFTVLTFYSNKFLKIHYLFTLCVTVSINTLRYELILKHKRK